MIDDIYGMTPIDGTAARVTGQSGCATDGTLSAEQIRENLVAKKKNIEMRISASEKGSDARKALAVDQRIVDSEINAIRPKRKGTGGVANAVVNILREEMGKGEFCRLISRASKQSSMSKEAGLEGSDQVAAAFAVIRQAMIDEAIGDQGNHAAETFMELCFGFSSE